MRNLKQSERIVLEILAAKLEDPTRDDFYTILEHVAGADAPIAQAIDVADAALSLFAAILINECGAEGARLRVEHYANTQAFIEIVEGIDVEEQQ